MNVYLSAQLVGKIQEESRLIPAIALFREETGKGGIVLGLRECKDIVKAVHSRDFARTRQGKSQDEYLVKLP